MKQVTLLLAGVLAISSLGCGDSGSTTQAVAIDFR